MTSQSNSAVHQVTRVVRWTVVPIGILGVCAAIVGYRYGIPQGHAVVIATLLVILYFGATLGFHLVMDLVSADMSLALALSLYFTKVSLLTFLLIGSDSFQWFDSTWFAVVAVPGTILWMILHNIAVARARILVADGSQTGRPDSEDS